MIAPSTSKHYDRLSKKIKQRSPLTPQKYDRLYPKNKQRSPHQPKTSRSPLHKKLTSDRHSMIKMIVPE
jgi:hypothetical protein